MPGLLAYRALELLAIEAFRSLLSSGICRLHTEAGYEAGEVLPATLSLSSPKQTVCSSNRTVPL